MSSSHRDGTRSLVVRRSPRGRHSRWRSAAARAARTWRCWRPTRSRRSASSPLVRARSRSGRSESSRTGAGSVPSARPRITTRSRSSPIAYDSGPTRTPSPKRPTRPRSASSSSSRVRRNTSSGASASTASRLARRSRAASIFSAARRSSSGQRSPGERVMPTSAARPRSQVTRADHGAVCARASPTPSTRVSTRRRSSRVRAAWRRARSAEPSPWPAPAGAGASSAPAAAAAEADSATSARWSNSRARWASRLSQSDRPDTTPARREMRSQAAVGARRCPAPPAAAARARRPSTSARRKPWSARARRSSSARPATVAASGRTAAPLRAMPAAARCSCTSRP